MKLSELNNIKHSLARLLTAPGIPAKTAYRVSRFSKAVSEEIKELEDARIGLVRKYGLDDGSGNVQVPPEVMAQFNAEFGEVLKEEVSIPVCKISIDDVGEAGLTMIDVANLDFLFEGSPTTKE